jgi:hypothetical protein
MKTLFSDSSLGRALRVLVVVLAIAVAAGGLWTRMAVADQPHMQAALEALRTAERQLNEADNDKGGHRRNALELVRRAIRQVEEGINFDRRH